VLDALMKQDWNLHVAVIDYYVFQASHKIGSCTRRLDGFAPFGSGSSKLGLWFNLLDSCIRASNSYKNQSPFVAFRTSVSGLGRFEYLSASRWFSPYS
jgi:hypothetical protein